ncbi:MAG: hypothetical protein H6811_05295 [Phycisphaeraceae bacterium]|nr:hypothetical protein [Phycisphaeraceae bacterium]
MARCELDTSVSRKEIGGFRFPLGVYPIEDMAPVPGYCVDFEPADGGEESGEWEEWPDRYVYEVVISAERSRPLLRSLFSLLPARVFPILDVMGHDAFREIDPYIAYEPIGLDRFLDGIQQFGAFLFEDGLCGFGALSDDPFFYVFLDEHKIITIRCLPEGREGVERVLKAFDLTQIEEPAGADAAAHEHRSVLVFPEDRPDLLMPEEIVERLRDDWALSLNVDAESNIDDDGNDLGVTRWRCVVRVVLEGDADARYGEILLHAGSLARAEEMALDVTTRMMRTGRDRVRDTFVLSADRVRADAETELLTRYRRPPRNAVPGEGQALKEQVIASRWLG